MEIKEDILHLQKENIKKTHVIAWRLHISPPKCNDIASTMTNYLLNLLKFGFR